MSEKNVSVNVRKRCREIMTGNVTTADREMNLQEIAVMMRDGDIIKRLPSLRTIASLYSLGLARICDSIALRVLGNTLIISVSITKGSACTLGNGSIISTVFSKVS